MVVHLALIIFFESGDSLYFSRFDFLLVVRKLLAGTPNKYCIEVKSEAGSNSDNKIKKMWRLSRSCWLLIFSWTTSLVLFTTEAFVTPTFNNIAVSSKCTINPTTTTSVSMVNKREIEIRRKIMKLKKEGKIKTDGYDPVDAEIDQDEPDVTMEKLYQQRQNLKTNVAADEYADKIKKKLRSSSSSQFETEEKEESYSSSRPTAQLGSLTKSTTDDDSDTTATLDEPNVLDPSFTSDQENNDGDDNDEDALDEEDLLELVAQKMDEKRQREELERQAELNRKRQERTMQQEANDQKFAGPNDPLSKAMKYQKMKDQSQNTDTTTSLNETTTGTGGAYIKNETAIEDKYRPTRGSWGYFERPKDISKAYGGGRKIVADDAKIRDFTHFILL